MPAYRFCRPDDVPQLVRAVNDCYVVHFPAAAPMTVEAFRAEMKEIDLWPSNSMVALAGDDPIAVLIGTKREQEVMILRVGVRPDHLRQGHGGHLVTSLGQKLAVLGPPRLVAEVPLDLPAAVAFFTALDYRRETTFVDWSRPGGGVDAVPEELTIPVTVGELLDDGFLDGGFLDDDERPDVAWRRTRATLVQSAASLRGLAIATPERLEAFLLTRESPKNLDVVAAGCRERAREEVYLGLLLRALLGRGERTVRVPRLAEGEMPPALLESLGFEPGRRYARFAGTARPA